LASLLVKKQKEYFFATAAIFIDRRESKEKGRQTKIDEFE
jgi:hypothetical protein